MNNKNIYMDNAATTQMKEEVLDAMMPYLTASYGNPSSIYQLASKSRVAIEDARLKVAEHIGAKDREIFFTAGGSESDNWAIKGVAYRHSKKGKHIITTKIEHHAVLHSCQYLEKQGFEVTYLDVDADGLISLEQLEESIKDETILITIMFANNEMGTIQPIKEIGEIAKKHEIIFHTDAVQALGHIDIDVDELNIDIMSMSGHKIYGPKGVGAQYIRQGVRLDPLVEGGAQERNKRAGTENVPGIVGFAKAVELSYEDMEEKNAKLIDIRDHLITRVENEIDHVKLNGHRTRRLPGNFNMSFLFIEGEALLLRLDMVGISASSGSACTSGSLDPSHVLMAMGMDHETSHGSLRLSLGDFNTKEEADYVVDKLKVIVDSLRSMSPLYDKIIK